MLSAAWRCVTHKKKPPKTTVDSSVATRSFTGKVVLLPSSVFFNSFVILEKNATVEWRLHRLGGALLLCYIRSGRYIIRQSCANFFFISLHLISKHSLRIIYSDYPISRFFPLRLVIVRFNIIDTLSDSFFFRNNPSNYSISVFEMTCECHKTLSPHVPYNPISSPLVFSQRFKRRLLTTESGL